MTPVVDPQKLGSNVFGYLNYEAPDRIGSRRVLEAISSQLPETVIFGGMLREFALGNAGTFSSDIDLVSIATTDEIENVVGQYSPRRNKFGGFRFEVGRQVFDIWSFHDTWAFREGLLTGNEIGDLLKTTFFNVDSVALSLGTKSCLLSQQWEYAMSSRVLDINLEENPSPQRMVRRAITMLRDIDFAIGNRLAKFILSNSSNGANDWIGPDFLASLRNYVESEDCAPFRCRTQSSLLS